MARDPGLDFSFSGLKTALVYAARDLGEDGLAERRADLAASFQAAVVGQLTAKLERALDRGEWPAVALGGGVAANGPLRERVGEICAERGLPLKLVAARALHGQRGDDRRGGRVPRAGAAPGLSRLGRAGVRLMVRRLVLYGRPECHLCDEAREILSGLVAEAGDVELVERNIEDDDDLHRRFLERIPVIELDGHIIGELVPDPERLRSTLLNNSTR